MIKLKEKEKLQKKFLEKTENYVNLFEPKYFMPFAGRYTLGGKLSVLNNFRGITELDSAYTYFINSKNNSLSVESIQNLVASHFNLNIQELLSPRRSRSLARPRQIAMYLAKQYTTNSLPDIGRKFSNRDHTTVIHAVKKINELIKKDNEIRENIIEIKKKLL